MGELLLMVADEFLAVHLMPPKLADKPKILIGRVESHRLAQARDGLMAFPLLGLMRRYDFLFLLVGLDELKSRLYLPNQGVLDSPFPGQAGKYVHKKGGAPLRMRPHSNSVSRSIRRTSPVR